MCGVKVALGSRMDEVEAARYSVKDRKEWKALQHMRRLKRRLPCGYWFLFSFLIILLRLCGLPPGEWVVGLTTW